MNKIKLNGYSKYELEQINSCQEYVYNYGNHIYEHNIEVFKFLSSFSVSSDILQLSLVMNTDYSFQNQELMEQHQNCNKAINLKINNLEENTYEDYRNLLVVMCHDFRIIILVLCNVLIQMMRMKKVDFENKVDMGHEALYVYAPIAHRLGLGDLKSKLEDLALYYIDNVGYMKVAKKLEMKEKERYKLVKRLENELGNLLGYEFEDITIKGRSKTIYSIYSKTVKFNKDLEDLYDLQGIRIICSTVAECYSILGIIHHHYSPINGRFKDYIAVKKSNLYQSLHTAIIGPNDKIFEIQIRTNQMDEIAERGIASHWSYKSEENYSNNDIEEQLHLFRDATSSEEEKKSISDSIFESMIYTYTPNKKIIILPKESTVIDFAYRIHSSVAMEMTGALVNGKIKPFYEPLSCDDVVKINTKKGIFAPNSDWMSFVKTNGAKKKIKAVLKKQNDILIKEDANKGMELFLENFTQEITFRKKEQMVKYFKAASLNDFYAKFYNKEILKEEIIKYLNIEKDDFKPAVFNDTSKSKVVVKNASGIKTELSSCCEPVFGDKIVGVILSGRTIKVHRDECKNVFDTNRIIGVDFNEGIKAKYETTLNCKVVDGQKGLDQIVNRISKNGYALSQLSSKKIGEDMSVKLRVIVNDNHEVEKIMRVLMQERNIISVFRNC